MKFSIYIVLVSLCVFSSEGHETQTCMEAYPDGCGEGMFSTGTDECYSESCNLEECCLGICGQNGGIDSWISDAICDDINNNEICDYDGGDCCECTCTDIVHEVSYSDTDMSYAYTTECGYYSCKDPEAPCQSQTCVDAFPGGCEVMGMFNSESFDSDCQTDSCKVEECCVDLCGSKGGDSHWISDGYCDHYNNIPECDHDGGDCCECTCGASSFEFSYNF